MYADIVIPKPGMGIDEAVIVRWLKQVGDTVAAGEIIVEVETAKSTLEIEALASGVIDAFYAAEGDEVAVNRPIGRIATGA